MGKKQQPRWEQSVRWEARMTVPAEKRGGPTVEVCLAAWAADSVAAATAAVGARQSLLDALNAQAQVSQVEAPADA